VKNPVLLIPGIDDTAAVFRPLADFLQQLGWAVQGISLTPNSGCTGLDCLAEQVAEYVTATWAPDQPIDLIGFSMGGIVGRYYLQRLGGLGRVQRFITLSSPHQGSWLAYGRGWNRGCQQMQPTSEFLADLNGDRNQLNQIQFSSFWTPFDLMILPASSSQLGVGQEAQFPVLAHPLMLRDRRVWAAIATALSQPVPDA
jgi:triacylglycerol lipase